MQSAMRMSTEAEDVLYGVSDLTDDGEGFFSLRMYHIQHTIYNIRVVTHGTIIRGRLESVREVSWSAEVGHYM